MSYNKPFFKLAESAFLVLKKELGVQRALEIFSQILQKGLKEAYDRAGFRKGNLSDFIHVVSKRDKALGLKVKFIGDGNRIIYRFYTDPFPALKGAVRPQALDASYMDFKVKYLLGEGWSYRTTAHIWKGDRFTEHVIQKV